MKLWILSDLHDDRALLVEPLHRSCPTDFDVFVCAGDLMSGDIEASIEMVAALAGGKPSVFVAGNHEWMTIGGQQPTALVDRHGPVEEFERQPADPVGLAIREFAKRMRALVGSERKRLLLYAVKTTDQS